MIGTFLEMEIIARSDDYQITFHAAQSPAKQTLIITFGGLPAGLLNGGFGTDFCLTYGYDTIYTAQRINTQYQGLSLEEFKAAVAPKAAEYKNVVCYGPSLGGYAALYFGGSINARIIAAGPRLPAWPHLGGRSSADLKVNHIPLHDTPKSEHIPVVVFDPMVAIDKNSIETIVEAAYPTITKVEVPFAGHPVLVSLSKARVLRPLMLNLFDTGEVIDFERPGEGSAIWHRERGRYFLKIDPEKSKAEYEKSLAIEGSKLTFNLLIQCLIRIGDLNGAQEKLDFSKQSDEKIYELNVNVGKLATASGLHI